MSATDRKIDTPATRGSSRVVPTEVVSYRGEIFGPFKSATEAARWAARRWPDQEQDEDRTGQGWDLQVAGVGN